MSKLQLKDTSIYDDLRLPTRYTYHLIIAASLCLFSIVFCVIYNPYNLQEVTSGLGDFSFFFHVLMMCSIVFVTSCLARLIFWALQTSRRFLTWQYAIFCLLETTLIAAFIALYLSLFLREKYLEILPDCEIFTVLTLIYPYTFSIVFRVARNRLSALMDKQEAPVSISKFVDENKKMRLAIDSSSILFISAEANYVHINYLENGFNKVYLLRNSMKGITEIAEKAGLVRCHRSYFINPQQIKALSKNKENIITAELKVSGYELVPVSKVYYEAVLEKL